ncbi:hypothetical protein JR316_0011418 [Psilocybe cubensis]|uniref:Uncharacterized protein n=2 Tax=Psilocybe cubensis TaxID=181762 RepID=A0A8H7XWU8_PSICU|nr:hypothetical protein JR316_0011418 [Psilocybe cubensis]KAH9475858.1 hypothetical protein JR316_0011418 [Psilocybe cubensis]
MDQLDKIEQNSSSDLSFLNDPHCFGLEELPEASKLRARVAKALGKTHLADGDLDSSNLAIDDLEDTDSPLFLHLAHGLAYTTGSALGSTPPSLDTCLAAYLVPNSAGLTAGSRAWSKHSHRSQPPPSDDSETDKRKRSSGWWGTASGPVSSINEKSLALFRKVMDNATWRNLHWLPHQILVYEVRVEEGYGMRWSQDQSPCEGEDKRPWIFRGFLEPTMANGHELKWRHPISA